MKTIDIYRDNAAAIAGAQAGAMAAATESKLAQDCGCTVTQVRKIAALSLIHVTAALKSGNINQGYAQCYADRLTRKVADGECPPDRIQCRQWATLRATVVPAGTTVTFTVTPVGESFARELLVVQATDSVAAAPGAHFTVLQMEAGGVQATSGTVASDHATGNVPRGGTANAFSRTWQNYVVPSGVWFEPSNVLTVQVTNDGTQDGDFEALLTYDVIRRNG